MKPKATPQDLYECLSYQKWKTGLGMIQELKDKCLRIPWAFGGSMYVHLATWEEQGLVKSRIREKEDYFPEFPNVHIKHREYLKISDGIPEEFREKEGELEGELVLASA